MKTERTVEDQMDFALHIGIGVGFFSCIALLMGALLAGELTGAFRLFIQLGF